RHHGCLDNAGLWLQQNLSQGVSVHSRQSRISADMIAGPRNRPSKPQVATPPKMPNSTQMNGSRVALPITTGRTKWSATKVVKAPATTITIASVIDPWADANRAATQKKNGAPNGM